jgi:FixJ family two-component response regulator
MISIVDDDECARKAIEGLVRSLGYMVATYVSAEDFLDSHEFYSTSCLITDVHLPGLTGVELYRRLLADGFAAPTIFVTWFCRRADAYAGAGCRSSGFPDQAVRPKIPD